MGEGDVDDRNLVEKIEAWIPSPLLADMAVEVSHPDYRDFGGVKFPTKIRRTEGGFPALDPTMSGVRPNLDKAIGRAP